jgi:hypothetical protein
VMDQVPAAMAGLAQAAHGLHPTEGFFDLLSLDRADAITGMAGGPRVDGRAAARIILRHMRCAAARTTGVFHIAGSHAMLRTARRLLPIFLPQRPDAGLLATRIAFGHFVPRGARRAAASRNREAGRALSSRSPVKLAHSVSMMSGMGGRGSRCGCYCWLRHVRIDNALRLRRRRD